MAARNTSSRKPLAQVDCKSQRVDYWDKLSEGGEIIQCGWLKDKFGLSWQIVPTALIEKLNDSDPAKASRVIQAVMQMKSSTLRSCKSLLWLANW
jgi:predicted 3-demethylubiquinone-9 3-methyltransferase (glyoxalase superfamily)